MYGFERVSSPDQVTRLASGEVQCGHSHGSGRYYRRQQDRPAAVAAVNYVRAALSATPAEGGPE